MEESFVGGISRGHPDKDTVRSGIVILSAKREAVILSAKREGPLYAEESPSRMLRRAWRVLDLSGDRRVEADEMRPRTTLAFFASATIWACAVGHPQPRNATGVPDTAPDSTRSATVRELHRAENLVALNPVDTIVRNALWLRFKPNATQSERVAAVAAVSGAVVGGYRPSAVLEGYYLIVIPISHAGSVDVLAAIDRLNRLPRVANAILDLIKPPG